MRVLIAGAAGFLGIHLTDALLAEGHIVIGVDNLCTGSLKNLQHLEHEARFEFLERDICEPFDPQRVDYVFNFASPASPVDYFRLGIETLMVGSVGTRNIWTSQGSTTRSFCMPPHRSVTAIRSSIPRRKSTGGTSIPSARDRFMTNPSASPRRW